MPLLSILLPTFNREAYLRLCLDSLRATTVDCEIIVSDNASTDGTAAYLASVDDPRVRIHRQDSNIGPFANFNFLLGQATGELVCIFGDDDMAMPGCFESKLNLLAARPDLDMVYSMAQGMDAEGRASVLAKLAERSRVTYLGGRDEFESLFFICYISWQTLVFRRRALDAVGKIDEHWPLQASHDWYWLQRLTRGRQVAFLAEPTVRIRFHAASFTDSLAKQQGMFLADRLRIWRMWLLEDPHPPVLLDADWERMMQIVAAEAQALGDAVPAELRDPLSSLTALHGEYLARMAALAREVGAIGDPFRSDAPPWPLDALRSVSYLHLPAWGTAHWRHVVARYVTAFRPDDQVTLVLWLDPRQGVDAEEAGRLVEAVIREAGVDPGHAADLLLVADDLDRAAEAGLYASCSCLVSFGDPVIEARALRMNKPVLACPTPEEWRSTAVSVR